MINLASVLMMVTTLSLFDAADRNTIYANTDSHVHAQGKHCNGTVGCDCPGFKPKTDGYEWQKAYCRYCGHKKSVHK